MTKKFLVIAFFPVALMHGMEPMQNYSNWYFSYKGTRIDVTTKSLFEVDRDVNCIVVGHHEQNMLHKDKFYKKNGSQEGCVYECGHRNMYQKDRYENNSCFNVTVSKRFLLRAVEPRIIQEKSKKNKKKCDLEAAKKALDSCYLTSLHLYAFLHNFTDDIEDNKDTHTRNKGGLDAKTIAFANLGVAVGFPKKEAATIAVTRTRKFITKYPKVYDKICFILETQDELDLYRKLFEEEEQEKWLLGVYYHKLLKKQAWDKIFLLVYHGPQDEKSALYLMPREIIMKILYLIP